MIARTFSSIPKVVSIYQDLNDNDELLFWIFTSNERYDDEMLIVVDKFLNNSVFDFWRGYRNH